MEGKKKHGFHVHLDKHPTLAKCQNMSDFLKANTCMTQYLTKIKYLRHNLQELNAEILLNTVFLSYFFVFYIHIFRFFRIIFIFLHGSTFLSILDAILDFPGNNKKSSFLVSCINFMVSEICC